MKQVLVFCLMVTASPVFADGGMAPAAAFEQAVSQACVPPLLEGAVPDMSVFPETDLGRVVPFDLVLPEGARAAMTISYEGYEDFVTCSVVFQIVDDAGVVSDAIKDETVGAMDRFLGDLVLGPEIAGRSIDRSACSEETGSFRELVFREADAAGLQGKVFTKTFQRARVSETYATFWKSPWKKVRACGEGESN